MKLSGQAYQQLQRALLSAFPGRSDLEQMLLFQLGESLDTLVSGGNLADSVFGLIRWAVAQGRLDDLLVGARKANPGNAELRAFVENVWQVPPAAPTPVVPLKNPSDREYLQELLDIQNSNLRKLERQAALHGGIDVPLILLNQMDEARREIAKLAAQINAIPTPPPTRQAPSSARRSDTFSAYEVAMDELLRRLGAQHTRYGEALTYQQRLQENIDSSRLYGDTESTRAGRAQIIGQLNGLAQDTLGVTFNQLMA